MRKTGPICVVVAEVGTDWARHGDRCRERFPRMITLLQERGEAPQVFARRVRARLSELDGVAAVTLLCAEPDVRGSVAGRRGIVDASLAVLEGVPGRELSLILQGNGCDAPQWLDAFARGIEARDPGLDFEVEFDCEARAA